MSENNESIFEYVTKITTLPNKNCYLITVMHEKTNLFVQQYVSYNTSSSQRDAIIDKLAETLRKRTKVFRTPLWRALNGN